MDIYSYQVDLVDFSKKSYEVHSMLFDLTNITLNINDVLTFYQNYLDLSYYYKTPLQLVNTLFYLPRASSSLFSFFSPLYNPTTILRLHALTNYLLINGECPLPVSYIYIYNFSCVQIPFFFNLNPYAQICSLNNSVMVTAPIFTAPLSLITPLKNFNILANAIQKISRTTFDEHRSTNSLYDYTLNESQLLFITKPSSPIKSILNKNLITYADTNSSLTSYLNFEDTNSSVSSLSNLSFFSHPFLLALKSDASKYL